MFCLLCIQKRVELEMKQLCLDTDSDGLGSQVSDIDVVVVIICSVGTRTGGIYKEHAGLSTHDCNSQGYQHKLGLLYQQKQHSSQCSILHVTELSMCDMSVLGRNCTDLT
jgi:hypothetical protein